MTDPFNILGGPEFSNPPEFEQAVRAAVGSLETSLARFEELLTQVPEEKFTDEEWPVVERTAEEVFEAVERAEDGYVAVQYDSHAWYRIMENLEKVRLRLESAVGLMERVRERP
jgi:hypothetical protein